MIYPKQPKFIFIHLPKNAGSSITKSLASYFGFDREVYRPQKHKFLVARELSNVDDYTIFTWVRNPWARVVSYFHYLQQVRKPPHNLPLDVKFDDWMRMYGFTSLQTQYSQIGTERGCELHPSINFVGRSEHMLHDWSNLGKLLGIKCPLIHDKKTDHKPYQEYYNSISKDMVAKFYRKDIKLLKYSFE